MGIIINRDELVRALSNAPAGVTEVLASPHTWAVLTMGDDFVLRIIQSDAEATTVTPVEAICDIECPFSLPAKNLLKLVALMDGEISIELEESKAILECGRSTYRLPSRDAADFPPLPTMKLTGSPLEQASLGGGTFKAMIDATRFAVNKLDSDHAGTRYLWVRVEGGDLWIVGCDTKRLSIARLSGVGIAPDWEALLPDASISLFHRFASGKKTVRIWADDNHMAIGTDDEEDGTVFSRISALKYPDWEMIDRMALAHEITLPVDSLKLAIKRASLVGEDREVVRAVQLWMFRDGNLEIEAKNWVRGEAFEHVSALVAGSNPEDACVGTSGAQILDFLDQVKSAGVLVEFRDEQSILRLRPDTRGSFDWRYVVMPVGYASNPPRPAAPVAVPAPTKPRRTRGGRRDGAE